MKTDLPPGTIYRHDDGEPCVVVSPTQSRLLSESDLFSLLVTATTDTNRTVLGRLPPHELGAVEWKEEWQLPSEYDSRYNDLLWGAEGWDFAGSGWVDAHGGQGLVQRAGQSPADAGGQPHPDSTLILEDGRFKWASDPLKGLDKRSIADQITQGHRLPVGTRFRFRSWPKRWGEIRHKEQVWEIVGEASAIKEKPYIDGCSGVCSVLPTDDIEILSTPELGTFTPSPDATPVPSYTWRGWTLHGSGLDFVTAQQGNVYLAGALPHVLDQAVGSVIDDLKKAFRAATGQEYEPGRDYGAKQIQADRYSADPESMPPGTVFEFLTFPWDYGVSPLSGGCRNRFIMGPDGEASYDHPNPTYCWPVAGCNVRVLSTPGSAPAAPQSTHKKGSPMLRFLGFLTLLRYAPKVAPWALVAWLSVVDGSAVVKDNLVAWWNAPVALHATEWTHILTCKECDYVVDYAPFYDDQPDVCRKCGTEPIRQTAEKLQDWKGSTQGYRFKDGTVTLDPGNWLLPERTVVAQEIP